MRYKVSVIITNYNQENYIEQSIESVLGQNLKEVQIIIVDDGSTDSSSEIAQGYAEKFDNICYVRQENKGVSSARNLGITKAEAEYITFLDADDYTTKNGYEQLYYLSKKENAETAIGNIICFNNEKKWNLPYMKKVFPKKAELVRQIKVNNELHLTPSVNNKLFKRDFIINNSICFDETVRVGEDLLFTQKSLFLSLRTIVLDVDVLNYRVVKENEESLSKRISLAYFEQLYLVQQKLKGLYEELDIMHFFIYIENRQLKFFIDSMFSKGIYLSENETKELALIGKSFSSLILNTGIFEDLKIKDKLLLELIIQEKYEGIVKLLQIISNKSVNQEMVIENEGIYHYLYRYFPEEKIKLAVKELNAVHRIEDFQFNDGILTIGGYAFIEGISSELVRKELVFKNGKNSKMIELNNDLRTDITYIKSNNNVNYDNSGFETLNINLILEIGEGNWETYIRLICNDNIILEQKVEVILAQLRNHFKATALNSISYLPEFKSGKYLTFNIKKTSIPNRVKIKLGQIKRNIKYDLGFLMNKDYKTFSVIVLYKLFQNYLRKKEVWLIGERKDTAQDNSYHFFKYIKENHPNINIHYVIEKTASDVNNIKKYGNIISFNSIKHSLYLLISSKTLNSYAEAPNMYTDSYKKILKYYPEWQQNEKIFLQHGVIGVSRVNHSLHKNRTKYSLFVVSSDFEKDHVVKEFGYKENEVIVTGLARWDALEDTSMGNEVLLMPTWRSWIKSEQQLLISNYLKTYLSLLQSKSLHRILEKKNLTLTFYPHYQIQKLLGELPEFHEKISVVRQGEESVQSLLKRHSILITDYSTVSFDFAYMNKPVIFYQFDYDEFYSEHYNEGPINHKKELFGPVVYELDQLLKEIAKNVEGPFEIINRYIGVKTLDEKRITHSKRIFDEIVKRG